MMTIYKTRAKEILDSMKDLELHLCEDTDCTKKYIMKAPDTMCYHTCINFNKKPYTNIVIYGDLEPVRHGVVSDHRYNEDWFSSKLSPVYLAEKFLNKKLDIELAADNAKHYIEYTKNNEIKDPTGNLTEFLNKVIKLDHHSPYEYYVLYDQYYRFIDPDLVIGWGYSVQELSILYAIHLKFMELKQKSVEKQTISSGRGNTVQMV